MNKENKICKKCKKPIIRYPHYEFKLPKKYKGSYHIKCGNKLADFCTN